MRSAARITYREKKSAVAFDPPQVYDLRVKLPVARAQIRELPPAGTAALAEAFQVLSLVPERASQINADNPDGGSSS